MNKEGQNFHIAYKDVNDACRIATWDSVGPATEDLIIHHPRWKERSLCQQNEAWEKPKKWLGYKDIYGKHRRARIIVSKSRDAQGGYSVEALTTDENGRDRSALFQFLDWEDRKWSVRTLLIETDGSVCLFLEPCQD